MPIISRVGRGRGSIRTAHLFIYIILGLGALTVLYPISIMLKRSVSSYVEYHEKSIIPRYLYDDVQLYQKYLALKYEYRYIANFNNMFGTNFKNFQQIPQPKVNPALVNEWNTFKAAIPLSRKTALYSLWYGRVILGRTHRMFQQYALDKYGDLEGIKKAYGYATLKNIRALRIPVENPADRGWFPYSEPRYTDWLEFKKGLPEEYLNWLRTEAGWIKRLRDRHHNDIARLNRECGTAFRNFESISLPLTVPPDPVLRETWETMVRRAWASRLMRIDPAAAAPYREFLEKKYRDVARYNRLHNTSHPSFAAISLPTDFEQAGMHIHEWSEFMDIIPLKFIKLITTENNFRVYLKEKYGSLEELNRRSGTSFATFGDIKPPQLAADWEYLQEHKPYLRRHFLSRNYAEVIDQIYSNGRALFVTVVYLAGIILVQLIVNSLCAYALSRFRLSYGYALLLLFMVTMAFPAEITMIPNFILLKQLNLLNTFAALILPFAVNGFFIFVLKGYFDNLPRSLYEAASLDGMDELSIFLRITTPLSRPILAWLALQSFTLAYSAFLFALVVCQDPGMWTFMVWIYEMQHWGSPYMVMAALTIAAVPGLAVFILLQNMIMRGMVLPVEN